MRIFTVEDDADIRELTVYALENAGFEAHGFADGEAFFAALETSKPDAVLLDIMLPGEDGLSILRRIRANPETVNLPVIMLTAKGREADKVKGLNEGADDYVAKPFGVTELIARVRAVLRRAAPPPSGYGGLTLDETRRVVTAGGAEITLTFAEFELLRVLMSAKGAVLTRNQITDAVWGSDHIGESRAVDMHVTALRRKLGDFGGVIKTVRNVGYKLGD